MAAIPELFCWTRFGPEAGETLEEILRRKELERQCNDGIFLWGIGNSVGAAVQELVNRCGDPQVLFSPIRGAPRAVDMGPNAVVWTTASAIDGTPYAIPRYSRVTSREPNCHRQTHFALVCKSDAPLSLDPGAATLVFDGLRNLVSGRPIGSSQVTAVVARQAPALTRGREYRVALRTRLVYPHFVFLRNPVPATIA